MTWLIRAQPCPSILGALSLQVRRLASLLAELAPSDEDESQILKGKTSVGNWGWARTNSVYDDDDDDDLDEDDEDDGVPVIVVLNKRDLVSGGQEERVSIASSVEQAIGEALGAGDVRVHWASCTTGENPSNR